MIANYLIIEKKYHIKQTKLQVRSESVFTTFKDTDRRCRGSHAHQDHQDVWEYFSQDHSNVWSNSIKPTTDWPKTKHKQIRINVYHGYGLKRYIR